MKIIQILVSFFIVAITVHWFFEVRKMQKFYGPEVASTKDDEKAITILQWIEIFLIVLIIPLFISEIRYNKTWRHQYNTQNMISMLNHWRVWTMLLLLIVFIVLGLTRNPIGPNKQRFYASLMILVMIIFLAVAHVRSISHKHKPQQRKNKTV